jgi:uncharacterized coiled-coil DUF342 family protein
MRGNHMTDKPNSTTGWLNDYTEELHVEILELQDRVRDLEGDRDHYRDQVHALLDVAHHLVTERDRLRAQTRDFARQLREMRASLSVNDARRAA